MRSEKFHTKLLNFEEEENAVNKVDWTGREGTVIWRHA